MVRYSFPLQGPCQRFSFFPFFVSNELAGAATWTEKGDFISLSPPHEPNGVRFPWRLVHDSVSPFPFLTTSRPKIQFTPLPFEEQEVEGFIFFLFLPPK